MVLIGLAEMPHIKACPGPIVEILLYLSAEHGRMTIMTIPQWLHRPSNHHVFSACLAASVLLEGPRCDRTSWPWVFFVQYLHQLHQLHLQLELQHVTTIINYHWGDSNNSLRHPLAALSPRNHPRSLVPHGSWVCPNMVVIHGYTLYIPIPEIRVQELGLPGHSKISKPQSSSSPSNIAI